MKEEKLREMEEEKRPKRSRSPSAVDERKELARVRREEKAKIREEMKERKRREEEARALHESEKRRRQQMADKKRQVREEVRRTYRPLSPIRKPPKYMEPQFDDYSSDSETLGSEDTESDESSVESETPPRKKVVLKDRRRTPYPAPSDSQFSFNFIG
jgi:hypothetical protein